MDGGEGLPLGRIQILREVQFPREVQHRILRRLEAELTILVATPHVNDSLAREGKRVPVAAGNIDEKVVLTLDLDPLWLSLNPGSCRLVVVAERTVFIFAPSEDRPSVRALFFCK